MGLKIQLQKTCVYEFSQEFEVNSNAYSDKYRDVDFADFFSVLPIFRISADFCSFEL